MIMAEDTLESQYANFLWRAMSYIITRRPHERITIAILNEKAYDILDERDGKARAKGIN